MSRKKSGKESVNSDGFLLKRLSVTSDEFWQKTGSRYLDGNVPNVNLNSDGDVNVNRNDPDNRNENLRSRQKFPAKKLLIGAF